METISIIGSVEEIIFHSKESGYCVFSIDSNSKYITCVGTMLNLSVGENIKLFGNWVIHQIYGKQFRVDSFEKTVPNTLGGIRKYLSSGIITGLGEKTAEKIVDNFGEETLYIIENEPEKLADIKGISNRKAMQIHNIFCEQYKSREVILFLQNFDISLTYAMKIYKKYGNKTFEIVKENPYKLAEDIVGIGFKIADRIAKSVGISFDSPYRVMAGIKFVLNQNAQLEGNIYLPDYELIELVYNLLNVDKYFIAHFIKELDVKKEIIIENINDINCVYFPVYYYYESFIAKKLLELSLYVVYDESELIFDMIKKVEYKNNIKLDENQINAVKEAMLNSVLIITGGPGTGKTTIINTIIQILLDEKNEVLLAAPTGRAAKRMTEATNMEAQTIHRLLGINFVNDENKKTYDKNEENPIDADVVIIDEASMVDINIMYALIRAISLGTRLILVGDVDQLPSVGAGNILKDIISSNKIKVVKLDKIFRQAKESAIVINAHRINNGEFPILNKKENDFFLIKKNNPNDILDTINELVNRRIPNFIDCNSIEDIQILTPMRKGIIGVNNINLLLQNTLNPKNNNKNEIEYRGIVYREGDKVMQVKNNYSIVWTIYDSRRKKIEEGVGVFNGEQGIILDIYNDILVVVFDDNKEVRYSFNQIEELELAYAITIHKSQGSEYPIVIIPIYNTSPLLMSRNLLYTGVTRAKKLVILVGLKETIYSMIKNNREINRYSTLKYKINELYDKINLEY